MQYLDRRDAGQQLAAELMPLAPERPVIVALPRGGVPVGIEVARALRAPIEILAVRKIGAPGNPEYGTGVLDPRSAGMLGMTQAMLDERLEEESRELRRRVARYRHGQPQIPLRGRTAIVVDDGMATGMTDLAAVRAVRRRGPERVVLAVPVGSSEAVAMLEEEADRVVCLTVPRRLYGVGMWYEDFAPVSDEDVLGLLADARVDPADGAEAKRADLPPTTPREESAHETAREESAHETTHDERAPGEEADAGRGAEAAPVPGPPTAPGPDAAPDDRRRGVEQGGDWARQPHEEELDFELSGLRAQATLILPADARGLVVFAHGSGSGRMSPRNRAVATALATAGLASLLFDLLSEREARRRELSFDVPLLAGRLEELTRQLASQPRLRALAVGYFGASTGAAAAVRAAAVLGEQIAAVVSRGGRPDLAAGELANVRAPTLLIVGQRDREVLALNRRAASLLPGVHELVVVPGAGHLFEEAGALQRVGELAIEWFQRYLA
jgi:putative phosphoribosyl transferase